MKKEMDETMFFMEKEKTSKINKTIIVYSLIWIIIIASISLINISKNKEIQLLKQEVLQKSDEEILIEKIKLEKNKIIEFNNKIKILELNLQESNKINTCLKTQLDRLVEWLEYWLDYCKWENLNKFEGLE